MKARSYLTLAITTALLSGIIQSCNNTSINYVKQYTSGKDLYENYCGNCHAKDGSGLQALIPPLTDTSYITNNYNALACMVKEGISGAMIVSGIKYNSSMPGSPQLSNQEIADILTYITNNFGNDHGLFDVSQVESDLKKCP